MLCHPLLHQHTAARWPDASSGLAKVNAVPMAKPTRKQAARSRTSSARR